MCAYLISQEARSYRAPSNQKRAHSHICLISAIYHHPPSLARPQDSPRPQSGSGKVNCPVSTFAYPSLSRVQALEELRRATELCVTHKTVSQMSFKKALGGPSHQGKQQWVSDLSQ